MRILVITLGNPLRGDDGIGEWIASRLEAENSYKDVEIHHVIQLTPEWADTISNAEYVFIIDASLKLKSGTWKIETIQIESQDNASSTHHFSPALLLSMTSELYGKIPKMYFVSIGVESLDSGRTISDSVRQTGEEVINFLKKEFHTASNNRYTS